MAVSRRRLSCAEFAFPALSVSERLDLVRLLGFQKTDIELHVSRPRDAERARFGGIAAAVADSGLGVSDVFFAVFERDFRDGALNRPDVDDRAALRQRFLEAADVAADIGSPGMTVLPGVPWPTDLRAGWQCAVTELSWRREQAEKRGLELRIEPHIGSLVSTPELTADLVAAVPGLRLTLDPSHFVMQAIEADRIEPLVELAGHIHARASRPGSVQVQWEDDESNLVEFCDVLVASGYLGDFCIEYVPHQKWRCAEMDILSAVCRTRDALLSNARLK